MLEHPAAFETLSLKSSQPRSYNPVGPERWENPPHFYQRENWSLAGVTGSRSYNQSVQSCPHCKPLGKPGVPPPCALPLLVRAQDVLVCSVLFSPASLQPAALSKHNILVSVDSPIWTTRMNGIMQCVALCDWLLSLSVIVSGLIQTH